MRTELQNRCDLFMQNREVVHKTYSWDDSRLTTMAANIATGSGRLLDADMLKESEKVLKKSTGIFSEFRNNLKTMMIVKMALSTNPQIYFDGVQKVYEMLNRKRLFGSEERVLAAVSIYENSEETGAEGVVEKTYQIYDDMKKNHPFLTSDEDMPMAALLALCDRSVAELTDEVERCYEAVRKSAWNSNAVQTLSHVMALDPQPTDVKVDKIEAIYHGLLARDKKYSGRYELAALGTLPMLDMDPKRIVDDISEVDDWLKIQKGFGGLFGAGKAERMMYASLLVADTYMPEVDAQSVVRGGTLSAVVAQQVAFMVIIASTAASSAASN